MRTFAGLLGCAALVASGCGSSDGRRRALGAKEGGVDASAGGRTSPGAGGGGGAPPTGAGGASSDSGPGDAGPAPGTILGQIEWPGPVVLIEDLAPAAPSGGFISLRISETSILAGTQVSPMPGGQQAVIVKVDDDAEPVWVHQLARAAGSVNLVRVAGDPGGGVAFVTSLRSAEGPVDVGGGLVSTTATSGSFLLGKLDTDRNHVFSLTPTCSDYCSASSIAVDAAGNVAVGGFLRGTLSADGHTVDSGAASRLAWVGLFDPDGKALWLKVFGEGGNVPGLHFDGSGQLVTLGYLSETTTIDGIPFSAGAHDTAFLAALDASTGTARWVKAFGGDHPTYFFELPARGGRLALPMYRFDLAGDAGQVAYRAEDGVTVTTYDTAAGASRWATPVGGPAELAVGPSGVTLTGIVRPGFTIGGATVPGAIVGNDYFAGLDDAGQLTWFHDAGRTSPDRGAFSTQTGRAMVVRLLDSDAGGRSAEVTSIAAE